MIDPLADGIRCVESGDLNEARRLLSRAVSANPRSAEAWLWLGRALQDPDKQRYCFNTAKDLDPTLDGVDDEIAWLDMPVNALPPPPPPPPAAPRKTYLLSGVVAAGNSPAPDTPAERPPDPRVGRLQALASDRFLMILVGILLGLLLIGIPGILLIQRGALDAYIPTAAPAFSQVETPAGLVQPTAPAQIAAESTFTPTPTFVNAHPLKATATPLPQNMKPLAGPVSNQSAILMAQSRFEMAIPLLDREIADHPADGEAYARRGMAYVKLVENSSAFSIDESRALLERAIADLDEAVHLGPPRADDYFYRATAYATLSDGSDYRVDREQLDAIALTNMQAALAMGTQVSSARKDYIDLLNRAGRCAEAMDLLQKTTEQDVPGWHDARYYDLEAASLVCQGRMEDALASKSHADEMESACDRMTDLAFLQYNLGKSDLGLDTVNRCIQASPSSGGMRYYLRALIEYQRGQSNQARQDLTVGENNHGFTGGIHDYVLALMMIDDGNTLKAIHLLQQAEASMRTREGPGLLTQVRNKLAALGGARLTPTPSYPYQGTPLPPALLTPPPQSATPTPASNAKSNTPPPTPGKSATPGPSLTPIAMLPPADSAQAAEVDVAAGTGNITLRPQQTMLFHFKPAVPISTLRGTSVIFHWSLAQANSTSVELQIWGPGYGWLMADIQPGDVNFDLPNLVVLPNGDVYARLNNMTDQTIEIANASFRITVKQPDGTYQEYGYRPGA
jgi:tetratricopeptide (TPR) repeat protein